MKMNNAYRRFPVEGCLFGGRSLSALKMLFIPSTNENRFGVFSCILRCGGPQHVHTLTATSTLPYVPGVSSQVQGCQCDSTTPGPTASRSLNPEPSAPTTHTVLQGATAP